MKIDNRPIFKSNSIDYDLSFSYIFFVIRNYSSNQFAISHFDSFNEFSSS